MFLTIIISVLISLCLSAALLRSYEIRMQERLLELYKILESLIDSI